MTSVTAAVRQPVKTMQTGAKAAIAPASIGAVVGLASTRVIERVAYGAARGVFGTNTGPGSLTPGQKFARVVLKGGMAVAIAGTLLTDRRPFVSGAAAGAVAGFSWHVLNEFGINV